MRRARPEPTPVQRPHAFSRPLRLDAISNPYGPTVQVQDALAGTGELFLLAGDRETRLHLRLAHEVAVAPDWLSLANGLDELIEMLLLWRRDAGRVLIFPPTEPSFAERARLHGFEIVEHQRESWFGVEIQNSEVGQLPEGAVAYVQHPNDPSGTLLGSQSLVRLARRCSLVIVDERHAGYSGRTLAPFVREFDNLVVLQSFETWAGLAGLPFAYAIAPPSLSAELTRYRRHSGVAMGSVLAALATLDDLPYVRATVQRVREERARLYRMLRKLNMLTPVPSVANFVLAKIERGSAGDFALELARREIRVHRPTDPSLGDYLRFSAVSPDATDALKRALIEIAAPL